MVDVTMLDGVKVTVIMVLMMVRAANTVGANKEKVESQPQSLCRTDSWLNQRSRILCDREDKKPSCICSIKETKQTEISE